MDRTGLINKVKVILDEYTPEGVGTPFEEYIGPLLDESAREIVMEGPLYLLTPMPIPLESGSPAESILKYADDRAYIPVPSDFVRLHEVKFPLWKRSVREAISQENEEYNMQENEYLRSGYGRPFVALVRKQFSGGALARYLECGKALEDAVPGTALYVKESLPEDLAEEFADTLAWRAASKVLATLGDVNRAKVALEQSVIHLSKLIH
jgi:hypothetical protein